MAKVSLRGVNKIYGGKVTAVRDFNLDIRSREFVVLVGPSGCGKSTTLRMVAGLEDITEGEIRIDDRVVNDVPAKDRDIAMVFQNYALYPHMTVLENLSFGLRLRKIPAAEIKQRVEEAAHILGIEELLGRLPKELSGGQQQRVAVGRAIVRKPKVFLFDEPLSNLDAKMRVQMRLEIIKLHQRLQATMIYVTHDQVEAMTMGERIAVMKDGIVHQVAAPGDLYRFPADKFVAGFIGSPPMNFLKGRLIAESGAHFFDGGDFRTAVPAGSEGHAGRDVFLGIRPEHVRIGAEKGISAAIEVVEPMGSETIVHLRVGENLILCRSFTAEGNHTIGRRIQVSFDETQVRLFDAATGQSILCAGR